jgi:hypothetical protein
MAWKVRELARSLRALAGCRRGSTSLLFGIAVPILLGGVATAVDYSRLAMARSNLQNAADETALAGARELQLRQGDLAATTNLLRAIALDRIGALAGEPQVSVNIDPLERLAHIRIELSLPTLLLNNIAGQNSIIVQARARALGSSNPLCLVALDAAANDALRFGASTKLEAPGCTVHGNSSHQHGFSLASQSVVEAGQLCAVARVGLNREARANAQIRNDCPPMKDPLAKRSLPMSGTCLMNGGNIAGMKVLDPGTYCGSISIQPNARVELRPGIYVFRNVNLNVSKGAQLSGQGVTLHFIGQGPHHNIALNTDPTSVIDLSAPRTGLTAGLLITSEQTSAYHLRFYINSEHARRLLGTIYLPSGDIWIGNGKPVADQSAFTIIVARKVQTRAGPNLTNEAQLTLVLNRNYHLTDVPVPFGLGNNQGSIQLVR